MVTLGCGGYASAASAGGCAITSHCCVAHPAAITAARVFTPHSLLLCLFFGRTGIISHVATRAITAAVRGEETRDIIVEGSK